MPSGPGLRKRHRRHLRHDLRLLTSNDNLDAIRFYQRRGLRLVAVYPEAIDEERRRFKSEIPLVGRYGIPIRDELEFELELRDRS